MKLSRAKTMNYAIEVKKAADDFDDDFLEER